MKLTSSLGFTALALAAATLSANAQWAADAKTRVGPGNDTQTTRLYLADGTTPAPVGSMVWFVADFSKNDIGAGGVLTATEVNNIRNGIGDDILLFTGSVDGTLPLSNPGRIQINVPNIPNTAQYANASYHIILWNSNTNTVPGIGSQYGELELTWDGVVPAPLVNAAWWIDQNVVANLTVVPEPSTYALFGLGGLGLLLQRRLRKK